MPEILDPESPAVRAHLSMNQDIIRRMAENSRACKNWCIATFLGVLLSAIILEAKWCVPIALTPVLSLMLLDAHYLALERAFREEHRRFIEDLHQEKLTTLSLFVQGTVRNIWSGTLRGLTSFSVYGFYGPLALTLAAAWWMLKTQ